MIERKSLIAVFIIVFTASVVGYVAGNFVIQDVQALGNPSPVIHMDVSSLTQKIEAGSSTEFTIFKLRAEWEGDEWFNMTVGSRITREQRINQSLYVGPLPEGIEVIFPEKVLITTDMDWLTSIPVIIKTSPKLNESTIYLTILLSGTYRGGHYAEEYQNKTFYTTADIKLYITSPNTPLGEASTIFWEGFDRLNKHTKPKWIILEFRGSVSSTDYSRVLDYEQFSPLRLIDFSTSSIGAEKTIPRLNNSFILEFYLKYSSVGIKFELLDSTLSKGISVELSNNFIQVQNISYSEYKSSEWHKFRFEVNAESGRLWWYLDDKYMDTLLFEGSPNKISIVTTPDRDTGTAYVDDIHIQKIIEIPDTTITITNTKTITSKTTLTSTSIKSTTTILNITETKTETSTETITDPSIYTWAAGATIIAIVFPIILTLKRR